MEKIIRDLFIRIGGPFATRPRILLVTGVGIFALTIVQAIFVYLQSGVAASTARDIQALLRQEINVGNLFLLSRSINDLQDAKLFECAVIQSPNSPTPYLDLRFRNPCKKKTPFWLSGTTLTTNFKALNGEIWTIEFQSINGRFFYISLWLSRFIALLSLLAFANVFYRRLDKSSAEIYRQQSQKEELRRISESLAIELTEARIDAERKRIQTELASQVAHDIRSPLATLEVVLKDADQLPADQRTLIRNASNRIREIASDLLQRNRAGQVGQPGKQSEPGPIALAPLISEIFAEKQTLSRENSALQFALQLDAPLAFSKVPDSELKRALSNLVNNSIEATQNGRITLFLRQEGGQVLLGVSDEGKGIPPEMISKLGSRGASFGKDGGESGSGLGLYQARRLAEEAGGELLIESELSRGTTIAMVFPDASPEGGPSEIDAESTKIIVLDDDPAIGELWGRRLSECKLDPSSLLYFRNTSSFSSWLNEQSDLQAFTFLIDQEITGSPIKGLDLIAERHIESNSILVTNLASDPGLQAGCRSLGVRLLPKELIPFIPFRSSFRLKVLLDDDTSIHTLWKITAKRRGIELEVFSKSADLLQRVPHLDRRTEIFLDENLGDGEASGSDVAEQLGKLGFKAIFLCTGFNPGTVSPSKWIRKVIGKEPPWV